LNINMKQELTGYDLRIDPERLVDFWDSGRKSSYLIKTDILYPLSVDNMVWPSIFDDGITGIGLAEEHRKKLGLTGFPIKEWVGPNKPFWSSEKELLDYAKEALGQNVKETSNRLIRVHRFLTKEDSAYTAVDNFELTEGKFCGYDVADQAFLSALANINILTRDNKIPDNLFNELNKFHLFNEIEKAFEYKAYISCEVREHVPFYVFGIWEMH
jgi:hypothetical protein